MLRLVIFLALLTAIAFGTVWLVDNPGALTIVWLDRTIQTTVPVALAILLMGFILLLGIWALLRMVFLAPQRMGFASAARRKRKAYDALSRGMIAAGAGDIRRARAAAGDVARILPKEPMRLLLNAQVAQMSGDRSAAEAAFAEMARHDDTRLLGLRGLYIEAQRRGDEETAYGFAAQAHQLAALPWAGEAVVTALAGRAHWSEALATVETNARGKVIDMATAQRQRAVLETAMAQESEMTDPASALKLARRAVKHAPDLVPANVLAARLLARRGNLRMASKLVEDAWQKGPHPDLAQIYLDIRPGNSSTDRYARAKILARLAPDHPESAMALAQTALSARDFTAARSAMAPLVEGPDGPTGRMCLVMAEIEESEFGETGLLREWLARGLHARRDPTWVADGVLSSRWVPVSPVTGKLDAFQWAAAIDHVTAMPAQPALAQVHEAGTDRHGESLTIASAPESEPQFQAAGPAPAGAEVRHQAHTHATPGLPGQESHITAIAVAVPESGNLARPVIFPLPTLPDDPGAIRNTRARERQ